MEPLLYEALYDAAMNETGLLYDEEEEAQELALSMGPSMRMAEVEVGFTGRQPSKQQQDHGITTDTTEMDELRALQADLVNYSDDPSHHDWVEDEDGGADGYEEDEFEQTAETDMSRTARGRTMTTAMERMAPAVAPGREVEESPEQEQESQEQRSQNVDQSKSGGGGVTIASWRLPRSHSPIRSASPSSQRRNTRSRSPSPARSNRSRSPMPRRSSSTDMGVALSSKPKSKPKQFEDIKVGDLRMSMGEAKLWGLTSSAVKASKTNHNKDLFDEPASHAKVRLLAAPKHRPDSDGFYTIADRENCTFRPRQKSAKEVAVMREAGFNFADSLEDEKPPAPPANNDDFRGYQETQNKFREKEALFTRRMDASTHAKRKQLLRDCREKEYQNMLDKKSCPVCGQVQSFDEYDSKSKRCKGEFCNRALFVKRNVDVHKFEERQRHHMTKSSHLTFLTAAEAGSMEEVKRCLSSGVDINVTTHTGTTAVLKAAANGHTLVVRFLANNGADMNHTNHLGQTAAHLAAEQGHAATFQVLRELGVSMKIKDKDGATAPDVVHAKFIPIEASRLLSGLMKRTKPAVTIRPRQTAKSANAAQRAMSTAGAAGESSAAHQDPNRSFGQSASGHRPRVPRHHQQTHGHVDVYMSRRRDQQWQREREAQKYAQRHIDDVPFRAASTKPTTVKASRTKIKTKSGSASTSTRTKTKVQSRPAPRAKRSHAAPSNHASARADESNAKSWDALLR